ncbi:DUF6286 domain-containing protein [Nocardia yamanashiensis]|uniref:DUF6286 domain-containing protein n=1 Tax=Nocardia yamanashiensis TaxID=209247 RepID=UPI001E4E6A47|nr:DUF6286 domain-containing protein [Nocardia yamanashiensis]UGT41670.1 DUF6286 domain-containing protein [Nocardia yamanashiensis]
MIRRSRRAGVATVVALALVALCVAVIVSLAQRLSGNREFVSYDSLAARLHGTEWGDPLVFGVGAAVALLGLALLVAAVLPGRAVVVPLRPLDGDAAGIERRSLRSALRRSADAVPGVSAARIKLRGKAVSVSAASDRTDVRELPDTVHRAVTAAFERIGTDTAPAVRTRVRPARRSSK